MSQGDGSKLIELTARTERTVLSACSYNQKFRAGWEPDPDLFSLSPHRAVADVMLRLRKSGAEWDSDAVALELRRDGKLEQFDGGIEGVSALLDGTPSVVDPWAELAHLRELKALRTLRHSLQDALRAAETDCDLSAVRALASEALAGSYAGTGLAARSAQVALAEAFAKAANPKLRQRGIKIGVRGVDAATGGLRRRNCWIMAAPSNWGKTGMAVNVFDRAVAAGVRVGLVYGEDPEELYAQRLLARRANVQAFRFRDHELSPEDMQRASEVVERAHDWGVFLDGIGRPVEELVSDMRSLTASEGIGIWLVDWLGAFRCHAERESQRLRIEYVARSFIETIKGMNTAGVLFSQVTQDKDGRMHIRDSEDVFNMAEAVLYGQSEEEPELDASGHKSGTVERKFVLLAKNKDGPKGFRVELDWEPHFAAFQRDDRIYRPADAERYPDN